MLSFRLEAVYMTNENKKIAIIGSEGFLGTRLKRRLKNKKITHQGFDIILDNPESPEYLDVENIETLEKIKDFSSIVNLAAVHRDDVYPSSRYDDVNVQGARNVCNAARNFGIKKIIFTSSVAIYGFAPENTDENGKPNFFNHYGRTKFMAEKVYSDWQAESPNERSLVIVRPTVIFGEGNRGNVYNLLKQIASGRFVMFGDGKNKKSMAYVENVAAFIEHTLDSEAGIKIYNYIDKPDYDMNELISYARKILFNKNNVGLRLPAFLGVSIGYLFDIFAKLFRITLPISSIRVKKFMGTTLFSSNKVDTAFHPPVSLEEGLKKTLEYEFLEDNSGKRIFKTE